LASKNSERYSERARDTASKAVLPQTGEEILFRLALCHSVIDQRLGKRKLFPREYFANDVIRESHPEPLRINLSPVSK
jgi:hypothetical protein